MPLLEATIALLVFAVLILALVPKSKLPNEVIFLLGSLAISLVPGIPPMTVKAQTIFFLFLPPILFGAAYFTSWRDFKANARTISLLAVALVLFTTTIVAITVKTMGVPISWPVAFLLGAILSPTDASATTSIMKKLGVPPRLLTLIEGESLVNDATGLIAYKFALLAVTTGYWSWTAFTLDFIFLVTGGVGVGLAVGFGSTLIYQKLKNSEAETLLSIVTPFLSYLLAEKFHASGVLSTVTAGLYFGRKIPVISSPETRMEIYATWKALLFVINGLAFSLVGFQLPTILGKLSAYPVSLLVGYSLGLSLLLVIIRFAWVFPAAYLPRKICPWIFKKNPVPALNFVTILGWAGMRGIVSLAAALSLPTTLPDGTHFPQRDLLIYLTYTVMLFTLIFPALTLPSLMRWLELKDDGSHQRDETLARLVLMEAVIQELHALHRSSEFPQNTIENLLNLKNRKFQTFKNNLEETAFSPLFREEQTLKKLIRHLHSVERKTLTHLRKEGIIHDNVFHYLNSELDLEDQRLKHPRTLLNLS